MYQKYGWKAQFEKKASELSANQKLEFCQKAKAMVRQNVSAGLKGSHSYRNRMMPAKEAVRYLSNFPHPSCNREAMVGDTKCRMAGEWKRSYRGF